MLFQSGEYEIKSRSKLKVKNMTNILSVRFISLFISTEFWNNTKIWNARLKYLKQQTSSNSVTAQAGLFFIRQTLQRHGSRPTPTSHPSNPSWLPRFYTSHLLLFLFEEKEYVKAVYCHPAYLTYMQSTS